MLASLSPLPSPISLSIARVLSQFARHSSLALRGLVSGSFPGEGGGWVPLISYNSSLRASCARTRLPWVRQEGPSTLCKHTQQDHT